MPVTDITTDPHARTVTVTARFDVPVQRVWDLYADPRQLEQVWGPEGYPATFVEHDLTPGGRTVYFMTGPEGERYGGWWATTAVDAPQRLEFEDGFAGPDLVPDESMPVSRNVYTFRPDGDATVATYVTEYATEEDLQKVLAMGMAEGTRSAMGQIDGFLAAHP